MNNGVRSTWRAFTSGTREGAKPRDNGAATPSQTGVDRPDLVPMVTWEICVWRIVKPNRWKWLIHLTQKGWCGVPTFPACRYVVPNAPGLQQAP